MKFSAQKRDVKGSGASRRLRRNAKVPGIVYGAKKDATPIVVDHNEIFHSIRKEKFHASILDMELEGKIEKVLLRDVQMHPYKPQVLHLDFQRVAADEYITVAVPLHFEGEENSPAVVVDKANVTHTLTEIEVECLPADLPEFILVDLSNLTIADPVRVSDLKFPEGVKPELKADENPTVASAVFIEEEIISNEAPEEPGEVPASAQEAPEETSEEKEEKSE